MIVVVNKHTHQPTESDVYIGRGSPLGNPYTSIQGHQTKAQFICTTREESISNFHNYILEKIATKDKLVCEELNRIWKIANDGNDVNLVCYCAPQSCHGTIIKKLIEDKLKKLKTYKGVITELKQNQIAVVGTNTQGRHGKGFALFAKENFGAIYGQARGLQGKCYGIVTKDLTKSTHPSRTPDEIKREIKSLYEFARENSQLEFLIPYNGEKKNLNFYSNEELANFFSAFEIPKNIVFEEHFFKLLNTNQLEIKKNDVDGVNHINVYSKGNTLLGRLLSNFANTKIMMKEGIFESVESWWYWVKMTNINSTSLLPMFSDEQLEEIKNKPGWEAKNFFRKLYKEDSAKFNPTKDELKKTYILKLEQHPNVKDLLFKNELPLRHYYVMHGNVIEPKEYFWTAELWQEIKNEAIKLLSLKNV